MKLIKALLWNKLTWNMLDWHTPDGTSWACSPDFDEWWMFLDFKVFFES
jgi:hypothetical protein